MTQPNTPQPSTNAGTLAMSAKAVADLANALKTRAHPQEQAASDTLAGVAESLRNAQAQEAAKLQEERNERSGPAMPSGKAVMPAGIPRQQPPQPPLDEQGKI